MKRQRKTKSVKMTGGDRVEPDGVAIWEVLAPLDAMARAMETKWGMGRLPSLVSEQTAARFGIARQSLDDAIEKRDVPAIAETAANLRRGWEALDQEATATGAAPIAPDGWAFNIDGRPAAIVRTQAEATALGQRDPDLHVYTLEEVGRLLALAYRKEAPALAKVMWPDAKVTEKPLPPPPSKLAAELNDEIPF